MISKLLDSLIRVFKGLFINEHYFGKNRRFSSVWGITFLIKSLLSSHFTRFFNSSRIFVDSSKEFKSTSLNGLFLLHMASGSSPILRMVFAQLTGVKQYSIRMLILLTVFFGLSQSLSAQDPNLFYYISDGDNTLYLINRNTGAVTTVGATGVSVIEAIAYLPDPDNRTLFAADAGNFGTLDLPTDGDPGDWTLIAEIDDGGTANGSAGAQELNDVDGLMLDARSFIMWAVERNSGAPDLLFQIDINPASARYGQFVEDAFGNNVDYLQIVGESINIDVDDLAVDPATGEIYGVTNSSGSGDALFRVNKATGVFEFVATLGDTDIEGLSFSNDGRLYGSKGSGDQDLIEFDLVTGAVLNRFEFTSGSDVEGLAALVADANKLSGTVYNDLDLDGIRDVGTEPGIQNVTVYLYRDLNGDGQVDPEDTRIQTAITDSDGNYTFLYATTGTLLVTTEFSSYPTGFALTTDNIELAAFNDGVNFGETDINNNFGLATGADCDGDGLGNFEEGPGDADGDGISNQCDLDSDNDGILDSVEGPSDFDDDGIPNYLDRDSDDDGIPDAIEALAGQQIAEFVSTQGNLSGTDSDGNGIIDIRETSPGSGIIVATPSDSDGDGFADYLDLDSDNDGILDIREAGASSDNDNDGQVDNFIDANSNGFDDALEVTPLDIFDTDSDGLPDYIDQDSDADGIDDTREGYTTSGYAFPILFDDVDQDGIIDFWDVSSSQTPIVPFDNDSDGTPDYRDINSDNDSESDLIEGNDADFDGIADSSPSGTDANNNGIDDVFDGACTFGLPCNTNVSLPDEDSNAEYDFRETGIIDSDFDGVPDTNDIDDDNDGILDVDEGTNDGICNSGPTGPSGPIVDSNVGGDLTLINNTDLSTDNGIVFDEVGDYIVIDMGSILPTGAQIIFTLWDDNDPAGFAALFEFTEGKNLRFAELTSSTPALGGGTNAQNQGEYTITNSNSDYTYTLANDTRYVQIEMTAWASGRFEVIEATIQAYESCTGGSTRDSDGDGIIDSLDLDSDNDGIPDIIEAGGVDTDNNGRVDNYVEGNNVESPGLAFVFESGVPAGQSNQPLPDSDGDGRRNDLDLDSDNDGIQDIIEAGGVDSNGDGEVDTATDTNNNGWADTFDLANGGTALADTNTDGDNFQNRIDIDSDGDGIVDLIESQATTGSPVVPVGTDSDNDGIDNAFEGNFTNPVDTDNDGIPDYLDTNSDNDSYSDLIEGSDFGGDFIADVTPAGNDADGDGLDDAFENGAVTNNVDNVYNAQDALDFPDVTTNGGSDQDWREVNATDTDGDGVPDVDDIDDDNDGVLDVDETTGGAGSCPVTLVVSSSGVASPNNIVGAPDGAIMEIDTNGEVIVVDFGQEYPAGTQYSITWQTIEGGTATMILNESTSPASGFVRNFSAPSVSQQSLETDVVTAAVPFRYLQITKQSDPSVTDFGVDAIVVSCTGDIDTDQDGIPDRLDLDSDNDGIFDIVEAGGVDSNQDGRVDGSSFGANGWEDTYDNQQASGTPLPDTNSDTDGLPNRIDIDSDGDGIVDLIESQATTGAPVRPLGNDSDGDGIDNAFDLDNGGTPTNPVDTDNDSTPDYLDSDSDNDGLNDNIEGWDNNGDYAVDVTASGTDSDNDGLDDAYDNLDSLFPTLNVSNGQTSNSFPNISTVSNTTERDWRETNATTCSPGGVSTNIAYWVRADDGGFSWRDISNNYNTTTYTSPSTGSPDDGAFINFNPTVEFSGDDYYVTNLAIDAANNPNLSVIAVYRPQAANAEAVWGEQDGGFDRFLRDGAGNENEAVGNGSANENNISGLFNNGDVTLASVIYVEDAGGGSSVRINGESSRTFTANQAPGTSNNLQVGAVGNGTDLFIGDIAELVVYDNSLNSGDLLRRVESYMALKYGITLAGGTTGDYLNSSGDPIWDASEAGNFQNNVAGIGRDDGSCLNQLQSKSLNSDAIVTIGLDSDNDGLETSNANNPSSFGAEGSLIWGHDGTDLYDNEVNIDMPVGIGVNSRLNREWRVQETGTVGQVTVTFDVSNLLGPGDVVGASNEAEIVLLVDSDGDFTNGAQKISQSFTVADDGLVNFQVDLPDGFYFTLGSGEDNALPITLLSFEAIPQDDHILLQWSTASEQDNSLFRVERSTNGIDFEPVGFLDGSGNSTSIRNYKLKDSSPNIGVNYYRLVDIDMGGSENFSEIVTARFKGEFAISKPYPNPVRKGNSVNFDIPSSAIVQNILVYDASGKQIQIEQRSNFGQLSISFLNAKQGIYVISMLINGEPFRSKVIVTN